MAENTGQQFIFPPPREPQSSKRRISRLTLVLWLVSIFIAEGVASGVTLPTMLQRLRSFSPHPTVSPGSTVIGIVPPTVTACPASGAGRAPKLDPMTLGFSPNLVYIVNEFQNKTSTFGTLKRYDTITGAKTEILKLPQTRIDSAQLSDDGQWILFSADIAGQEKLSVVRMDGEGLQTLVCTPASTVIRSPQWSVDQNLIVFDESQNLGPATIYLLSVTSGALQTELTPPASGVAYLPRTWLDNTRVLLVGYLPSSDAPPQNIYILDTALGHNQQGSSLKTVATIAVPCWNFDSSFDGKTIFYNQCTPGSPEGSSTVISQSLPVGILTPSQVFSSSTLAINAVRVFERTDAFLLATASNSGQGVSGDHSKDGLYKIATDRSNSAILLAQAINGLSPNLTLYSQYFWSNVSRDGNLYALEESGASGSNVRYVILYGSLNGGRPHSIADMADGTQLEVAGWTTM